MLRTSHEVKFVKAKWKVTHLSYIQSSKYMPGLVYHD
jgi:hypothetical protein